jgi:hypothetical protein
MFPIVAVFVVFYWLSAALPQHARTLAAIALVLTLFALGTFKVLGIQG